MSTGLDGVTAGLSTERLARIDTLLRQRYLESGKLAGVVTLVARRGEIAHFSALGEMDAERGKPMATDTIVRIYSMSKPITSVALMTLYEEGYFQLDQPVQDFIPAWSDLGVWRMGAHPNWVTTAPERPMTVRDLLSHQAGLTYSFQFRHPVDAAYRELASLNRAEDLALPDQTLSEAAAKLVQVPLLFSPGTSWNYSVVTDICGYLVELISGQAFDAYLDARIFGPLGMEDTGFHVPDAKLDRFAACYAPTAEGSRVLQDDPETSAYRQPPRLLSGGAGLVSTADDYFRFCQMLLNGGDFNGVRILSRKTIELMTQNHLPPGASLATAVPPGVYGEPIQSGTGFGLGFSVLSDLSRAQIVGSVGQYAWAGAASTQFWIDPVEEVVVIFLTQLLYGAYPIQRELQVLVNAAFVD